MTNEEALDYAIHFLKLDYAPSEVVKCLENTKAEIEQLKAEKESIYNLYLEYSNITKSLKSELDKVNRELCMNCYRYEICLNAPMMKITKKYNNMISAFQCDFSLARNGDMRLGALDYELKTGTNGKLSKDIDLLEELEYGLRSGKLVIVEAEGDENG